MQRAAPELQENSPRNAHNGAFSLLPDEMVVYILHQLPPSALATLGKTNHYFAGLTNEELARRLRAGDKATIHQRLSFFNHQRNSIDEDIYDLLPPKPPFCHPAENACIATAVSIGLISLGVYISDVKSIATPLVIAGIIGLLASIAFIIRAFRSDLAVRHAYQRIDAIQDIETGLRRQLQP